MWRVFAMRDGSKTDFSGIGTGAIFFYLSMSLKGTSLFGGNSPYLQSFIMLLRRLQRHEKSLLANTRHATH